MCIVEKFWGVGRKKYLFAEYRKKANLHFAECEKKYSAKGLFAKCQKKHSVKNLFAECFLCNTQQKCCLSSVSVSQSTDAGLP
jgi:hypothetical protein